MKLLTKCGRRENFSRKVLCCLNTKQIYGSMHQWFPVSTSPCNLDSSFHQQWMNICSKLAHMVHVEKKEGRSLEGFVRVRCIATFVLLLSAAKRSSTWNRSDLVKFCRRALNYLGALKWVQMPPIIRTSQTGSGKVMSVWICCNQRPQYEKQIEYCSLGKQWATSSGDKGVKHWEEPIWFQSPPLIV